MRPIVAWKIRLSMSNSPCTYMYILRLCLIILDHLERQEEEQVESASLRRMLHREINRALNLKVRDISFYLGARFETINVSKLVVLNSSLTGKTLLSAFLCGGNTKT